MQETINRRIEVPVSPGKNTRPYQKITKTKKAWGMAQVVQYPSSKSKALCSNTSTTKKKLKKLSLQKKAFHSFYLHINFCSIQISCEFLNAILGRERAVYKVRFLISNKDSLQNTRIVMDYDYLLYKQNLLQQMMVFKSWIKKY
jgi:hypothetical protein